MLLTSLMRQMNLLSSVATNALFVQLSKRPTKKQLYEQTAFDEESKMVRPEEPPYVAKGPVWSPTGEKLLDKDNGL